ncbi:YeiH family protein [Lacticaseibacillus hulanensis]|uniref:YeiH family protein n=1 Tax=Lacticaseibacillus hulanensis TaxID=2493111 RepID=UPI001F4E9523|nr:putative sulfate exporter family transporter [Lacticaseibacillus hulanensis]
MENTKTISKMMDRAPIIPGLAVAIIVAIGAKVLGTYVPSVGGATFAILFGIVLGNTVCRQPALGVGTKFAESKLLEVSVVLLGLTVTFQTIGQIGVRGAVYVLLMMSVVISAAYLLGRKLGFSEKMALMMAGGNAVCGSSAIGAIAPAIDADDADKGQIITLVNLLGTVMMLTLPFLGTALFGKAGMATSALLGGTLQSVGQVVAGASLVNSQTVQFAMLFKIMRIIMLVVVVYLFTKKVEAHGSKPASKAAGRKLRLPIQWYVLGFLLFCILDSAMTLPAFLGDGAHFLSTWCETIALAAIGLRLDLARFIKEGRSYVLYALGVGAVQTVAAITFIKLLGL